MPNAIFDIFSKTKYFIVFKRLSSYKFFLGFLIFFGTSLFQPTKTLYLWDFSKKPKILTFTAIAYDRS